MISEKTQIKLMILYRYKYGIDTFKNQMTKNAVIYFRRSVSHAHHPETDTRHTSQLVFGRHSHHIFHPDMTKSSFKPFSFVCN